MGENAMTLFQVLLQMALALLLAPLVNGFIRKSKALLQNRRGPSLLQPYYDLFKLLRKGTVVSEHASWIFRVTPYISFLTALMVALMIPMITTAVPLSLFGGVIAVIYLLALGRFFLALAALDTASAFGGMGSSREMTVAAIAEPAMMLSIFSVAITAGSTNLSQVVQSTLQHQEQFLSPAHILAFAAMFIVLIAETGRIPVDNPATHLELTMIHEAMILEYSGYYLALIEWGVALKQLVLMTLLVNIFFPVGVGSAFTAASLATGLATFLAKLFLLALAVVLVETSNAKLRLFRVPELLSVAFILALLALASPFIF
jgi:formate hydrogenlyase subunit 4